MKKEIFIPVLALIFGATAGIALSHFTQPKPILVACVGDSITHGAYLRHRPQECYPARLQSRLGRSHIVRNFGVNSATVQTTGDKPYTAQTAYADSLAFQPDIVLLMLGTNDTKSQNRLGIENFRRDYEKLIDSYLSLPSHPQLYLMTPPPIFVPAGESMPRFSMHTETLAEEIRVIKEIASTRNIILIDLNRTLKGQKQYFMLDGVHPDLYGADSIARVVYQSLI